MNVTDVIRALDDVARPLGYRRKRGLLWKTGRQLTTLVEFQRTPVGRGVYVNIGAMPNRLITGKAPPVAGSWGIEERADCLKSPFRTTFRRLANNDEDQVLPDDCVPAFRWLLAWIEQHLANAAAVRETILEMGPDSCVSPIGVVKWAMREWANRKLR